MNERPGWSTRAPVSSVRSLGRSFTPASRPQRKFLIKVDRGRGAGRAEDGGVVSVLLLLLLLPPLVFPTTAYCPHSMIVTNSYSKNILLFVITRYLIYMFLKRKQLGLPGSHRGSRVLCTSHVLIMAHFDEVWPSLLSAAARAA